MVCSVFNANLRRNDKIAIIKLMCKTAKLGTGPNNRTLKHSSIGYVPLRLWCLSQFSFFTFCNFFPWFEQPNTAQDTFGMMIPVTDSSRVSVTTLSVHHTIAYMYVYLMSLAADSKLLHCYSHIKQSLLWVAAPLVLWLCHQLSWAEWHIYFTITKLFVLVQPYKIL